MKCLLIPEIDDEVLNFAFPIIAGGRVATVFTVAVRTHTIRIGLWEEAVAEREHCWRQQDHHSVWDRILEDPFECLPSLMESLVIRRLST